MPSITNFTFTGQSVNEVHEGLVPLNMIPIEPEYSNFSIIFSMVGFNRLEDHSGFLTFIDPNGEIIMETERFELPAEDTPSENEDSIISGISLGLDFGIHFEKIGLYKTILYFDNEPLGEFAIPVMQRGSEQ